MTELDPNIISNISKLESYRVLMKHRFEIANKNELRISPFLVIFYHQ